MGMFDVTVILANLAAPGRTEEVSLLVDTGTTLSWIPREILEKLGVVAFSRLPFTLADGHRLERDTTAVLMTIDGEKGPYKLPLERRGRRQSWARLRLKAWDFSSILSLRSWYLATYSLFVGCAKAGEPI
jgi:hypothetical protein